MRNKFLRIITLVVVSTFVLTSCSGKEEKVTKIDNTFLSAYMVKSAQMKAEPVLDMSSYPDKRFAPNQLVDCAGSLDPYACYLTVVDGLLKKIDTQALIEELNNSDIGVNEDCYRISKGIGALIANRAPVKERLTLLSLPYKNCPPSFVEGIYDQAFGLITLEELSKEVPTICTNLTKEISWNCHYYLGRALMSQNLNDPLKAASICMTIPSPDDSKGDHKTVRRSCLSGAWQTFFRNDQVIALLKTMNPSANDIFSFCLGKMSSSQDVCLQEDSPAFWRIDTFGDINVKFKACRDLSTDRNIVDQCYFGMGRGISDLHNRDNIKIMTDCASLINEKDSDYCFIAAGEALNYNDFTENFSNYCSKFTAETHTLCLRALGQEAFGQMGGSDIEATKLCSALSSSEVSDCVTGVNAGKFRVGFVHSTASLDINSIFGPCAQSESKEECYHSALSGMDEYYQGIGAEKLFDYCSKLDTSSKNGCLQGLGRAIGIYESKKDVVLKLCGENKSCQTGLSQTLPKRPDRQFAQEICSTLSLSCSAFKSKIYF